MRTLFNIIWFFRIRLFVLWFIAFQKKCYNPKFIFLKNRKEKNMSKKEGVMDADKAIAFFHDYVNGEGELLENGEPKSVPMSKEEALELQKLGAYSYCFWRCYSYRT